MANELSSVENMEIEIPSYSNTDQIFRGFWTGEINADGVPHGEGELVRDDLQWDSTITGSLRNGIWDGLIVDQHFHQDKDYSVYIHEIKNGIRDGRETSYT